jgi:uncharacterized protein YeaO (DUF488 family)
VTIRVRRAYDPPGATDGYRILVDRLWPRGISQEKADVDLWLRDVAPSAELRTWFGHRVERWSQFAERYRTELAGHGALLDLIHDIEHHRGTVTLLFGARDEEHNEARVLLEVLKGHPKHVHH